MKNIFIAITILFSVNLFAIDKFYDGVLPTNSNTAQLNFIEYSVSKCNDDIAPYLNKTSSSSPITDKSSSATNVCYENNGMSPKN